MQSDIPISVGLGSSAAAVIAGLLLGARYSGKEAPPDQVLRWAEEIEGHIDNAAAAYYGGLVLALSNNIDRVWCKHEISGEHSPGGGDSVHHRTHA